MNDTAIIETATVLLIVAALVVGYFGMYEITRKAKEKDKLLIMYGFGLVIGVILGRI